MKYKIIIGVSAVILLIAIIYSLFWVNYPIGEMYIILNWSKCYNKIKESSDFIQSNYIQDKYEIGKIKLKNGKNVKYIFQSHHLNKWNLSISVFNLNGKLFLMNGYFCCGIEIENQPKNEQELEEILMKNNWKAP